MLLGPDAQESIEIVNMWRPMIRFVGILALFASLIVSVSLVDAYRGQHHHRRDDCPRTCVCIDTIVNCTGRSLNFIPEELPLWTEVLLIAGNPLQSLAPYQERLIVSPNNLTHIDLSYINLRHVKHDFLLHLFNDVTFIEDSLHTLIFDHNQLSTFPLIDYLRKLKTLSLVANRLDFDSIAQVDISTYHSLETLDLSDNPIGAIPRHFLSPKVNTKLTSLILHNTRLDTIEAEAFDLFVNLRVLKLSRNNLATVSNEWLGHLSALVELDLNSNRIEQIGTIAFNGSKSLEVLKMRRNKLNHLPDGSFWGLSNLQKLNLDHNNITDVRLGWTFGLSSLNELTLRHNFVSQIQPQSWNPTPKLQELYLNHNQLQRIDPGTFSPLSDLKTLKLSNNLISFIDDHALNTLTTLEILDLADNQLSWAIERSNGFFTMLRSLKKLRLDNNEIHLILKHTFSGLSELTHLSISGNPISSIQNGSFSWFPQLSELNMENTDLLCDCTMKWLYEWLQSSEIRRKFAPGLRCKHPHHLNRQTENSMLDADVNEFQCQHLLKPYMIDDFKSIDKPISAIKGKNMTFYCKVATSNPEQLQFSWIKDNRVLDESYSRVKTETLESVYSEKAKLYTNVFTLTDVQDSDQGNYQCKASNNYDSVYSHKFEVNVHVLPYFIKRPQNITVKVGHNARLECAAGGQPAPHISWQKLTGDHFSAAIDRRMRFIPQDDVYFIVDVKPSDNGTYTCNASNDAGIVLATVHLNVIEPPSFVRKMANKQSAAGTTVSLHCMAAGLPTPKVSWLKDGVALQPTERHFFTAEGQVLIIVKLKPSDEGRYSCNISNGYGSQQDSIELKVLSGGAPGTMFASPPHHVSSSFPAVATVDTDDFAAKFLEIVREYFFLFSIIVICVLVTSAIWIAIFCILQRTQLAKTAVIDVEQNAERTIDGDEDDFREFSVRSVQNLEPKTSLSVPLYSPFDKEYREDLEYDSESSSGKDTGIEGSCESTEGDNEPNNNYSYEPSDLSSHFRCTSLPRSSHIATTNVTAHMSLPRNNRHRGITLHHHQHHHSQQHQQLLRQLPHHSTQSYPQQQRQLRYQIAQILNDETTVEHRYEVVVPTENPLPSKNRRLLMKKSRDEQLSTLKRNTHVCDSNTNLNLKTFSPQRKQTNRSLSTNDINHIM